jgi:alcohol dehydrogenase class IV
MACGNSALALVHALSSSPSVRVPHGLQNAILLPHVARFNGSHLGGETRALLPLIDDLYDALGLQASFSAMRLDVDGSRMVEASAGNPFRVNNVRTPTDDELVDLLGRAGANFTPEHVG